MRALCLPIAALALMMALPVLAQDAGDKGAKAQQYQKQLVEQRARAEMEKARAEAAKARAEADKARAEADKAKAEAVKAQAEAELVRIEADKARARLGQRRARRRPRNRPGPPPAAGIRPRRVGPAPGAHTHDGLFMRFSAGPGYGMFNGTGHLTTLSVADSRVKDTDGGLAGGSFSVGGAIGRNLILHGDVWLSIFADERHSDQLYQEFGSAVIGLGLTYYWMPYNVYLTGSLGMANSFLTLHDRVSGWYRADRSRENARGVGLSIVTGKEWWVSDNWALGVALQCEFSYAESEDSDLILRHGGAKVLFSATYQ